jgi:SAM-dependent methyltransferase
MVNKFKWNTYSINKFWNDIYSLGSSEKGFAELAGKDILRIVNSKTKLKGRVLDYGFGFGYLIKYISEYKKVKEIFGTEFSEESVLKISNENQFNTKYKEFIVITQVPKLPWEDNFFDFIFITEVVEHIEKDNFFILLNEFNRVLKTNGTLVITVPNDEDLEKNQVLCPCCSSVFHPVQHINSYNRKTLSKFTNNCGFKTKYCDSTIFNTKNKITLKYIVYKLYYSIFNKDNAPNLIYIGTKIQKQ